MVEDAGSSGGSRVGRWLQRTIIHQPTRVEKQMSANDYVDSLVSERGLPQVAVAFEDELCKRGIDVTKLSDDLAAKYFARLRAGYGGTGSHPRENAEGAIFLSQVGLGLSALFCSAGVADAALQGAAGGLGWGAGLVATVGAAGASIVGLRWTRRDPLRLKGAEGSELAKAQFAWPHWQFDLDKFANHAVLYRESAAAEYSGGMAVRSWREPQLVGVAAHLANEIRHSPAWRSDLFDVHRARIDLDSIVRDINVRAYRVWLVHANTAAPLGDSDAARGVLATNAVATRAADAAWETLVERVRMLANYRAELGPIEEMLHDVELLAKATSTDLDSVTRQLYVDAAINEFATRELGARAGELIDLRANLRAQMEFLRSQVTASAGALPIIGRASTSV